MMKLGYEHQSWHRRWLAMCEEGGIDSIWHSDQLLGPSPDPLVMTAAIAARTERMRIGISALVVPFREPLVVAKQITSIDQLSSGRLLPAFGVGFDADPYWRATGRLASERGARANEAIKLIRALLEQEEVSFDGMYYRYQGRGVQPQPTKPIPLWIGGDSSAAIRRTAELGDGWIGGLNGVEKTLYVVARIKSELVATGRTIDYDHYGATVAFRIGSPDDASVTRVREQLGSTMGKGERARIIAAGDSQAVVAHFRAGGIAKFVAMPIANDGEDLLDQTRRLATDVVPALEGLCSDTI